MSKDFIKSLVLLVFTVFCVTSIVVSQTNLLQKRAAPPIPTEQFSPSNAKTEHGGLISSKDFIPSARCGTCHQETHAEWSESLHRNSGREPFYKASVEILEKSRGSEFIQHCESCHSPATMFTGALISGSKENRALDEEGISCAVCHSITEVSPLGTSSYTIRKPYLLLDEKGVGVGNEATDKQIFSNIENHKRAVMNPVLQKPEFCASCHKSNAPPELNNYKFIRGYSTYDEWQQSGFSHESIQPFYAKNNKADCRSCHMPKTEATQDAAAKNGLIVSHRWLGANTAVPEYYGYKKQAELTKEFLKNDVLSIDIFALRRTSDNKLIAPLNQNSNNPIPLQAGDEVIADLVIFNRGAGHSFPPELRDLYEPWVEFEVINKTTGEKVFHSGFIEKDESVDPKAHVYKAVLLDEIGKPFTRHEVWLGTAKAYDASIPAGRADLVRYRFRLPEDDTSGNFAVRAKVNYRRYLKEYAEFVSKTFKQKMPNPVVEMAKAETTLTLSNKAHDSNYKHKKPSRKNSAALAKRWNDYGIGLLGQSQYGQASEAFEQASRLEPDKSDYLVNTAIAELKTERYGPELTQLYKAKTLLEKALEIDPKNNRAKFNLALINRSEGKIAEAQKVLAKMASEFPNDREIQRQLGQTLYLLGRFDEAKKAFLEINRIDPTDAETFRFLSPLFAREGSLTKSEKFQQKYLLWREDPLADAVANRFFTAHPEWADVRKPGKIYSEDSPQRKVSNNSGVLLER